MPNPRQAMGLANKVIKAFSKEWHKKSAPIMHGGIESGAKRELAGTTLDIEGKTRVIKTIFKDPKNSKSRLIVLDDDSTVRASREFVHHQSQIVGGTRYADKATTLTDAELDKAAVKSLGIHTKLYDNATGPNPFWSKKHLKQNQQNYVTQAETTGARKSDESLIDFQGRQMYMPSHHAKNLSKRGFIRIIKEPIRGKK